MAQNKKLSGINKIMRLSNYTIENTRQNSKIKLLN